MSNCRKISMDEALKEAKSRTWAYLRLVSSLYLGPVKEDFPIEELLEARFFDERSEVRILDTGDGLEAFLCEEVQGSTPITEKSEIRLPSFRGSLLLKKDIEYDEDGQAYIANVRFASLKEA